MKHFNENSHIEIVDNCVIYNFNIGISLKCFILKYWQILVLLDQTLVPVLFERSP